MTLLYGIIIGLFSLAKAPRGYYNRDMERAHQSIRPSSSSTLSTTRLLKNISTDIEEQQQQ